MNEFISERGAEILLGVLGTIITAICGVLTKAIKDFLKEKVKKGIVRTCVLGVEQQYKDLHGEEKYFKVASCAIEMFKQKKISVTDLELKMLIESEVGDFNQVFSGYRPSPDTKFETGPDIDFSEISIDDVIADE